LGFSDFDFEAKFLIFLPLEPYLKIFVWVKKDITYQNMKFKLAKIA
jgi:hypothetical protein